MISATQLRVGMTIMFNGAPHKVLSVQHVTPGNWRGMVQTKLRNLITGSGAENRFGSDDKVEKAVLEEHEMEYLYESGGEYTFMNTANYEQMPISSEDLGDTVYFLIPNVKFAVEFYDGKPVSVKPPKVVELKIVDTPPNMKGATASSSYKPAKLETGLTVGVPPFIETGEVIRIDTEELKYIERAR
ncbi:MAG: elongation factor P [Deltaproteobacteria bacterium]|nr:elongation factor P [Deltaproteobacteria bacterium]